MQCISGINHGSSFSTLTYFFLMNVCIKDMYVYYEDMIIISTYPEYCCWKGYDISLENIAKCIMEMIIGGISEWFCVLFSYHLKYLGINFFGRHNCLVS